MTLFLRGNREDILNNVGKQTVLGDHSLPLNGQNTETFLKISSLMFHRRKKVIHVWNYININKIEHIELIAIHVLLNLLINIDSLLVADAVIIN